MKYKRFIIENYKGITTAIEIDVEKNSLIPIIGINECGKTTILNSIFAFDCFNDNENKTFKHLTDIDNLYSDTNIPTRISAVIETTKNSLARILKETFASLTDSSTEILLFRHEKNTPFDIMITRILSNAGNDLKIEYELSPKIPFSSTEQESEFCKSIIKNLPYILYFDDFRETFPDEIEIIQNSSSNKWLDIIEELFIQTNENYSVYELQNIEERRRKSILSQVKKRLNRTLTQEWASFRLENKESLEIDIDFTVRRFPVTYDFDEKQKDGSTIKKSVQTFTEKYFLKFDIIERDSKGNEHYFYVKDRSKGFYWFFNFVMKLEFNPNIAGDHDNTIYLLDEPGSYLHPYAQSRLCKKLKDLSEKNIVIYCTHSHYLLNPEIIPLNRIHIANKTPVGLIELESFYDYKNAESKKVKTAFQTIHDALYIKPFDIDINHKKVLIVEGIYDYYAFSIFKKDYNFGILPGKGASTLTNLISIMIAYEVDFRVLWDNDTEGRTQYDDACKYFGEEMSIKHFHLLPSSKGKKRILQDLFHSSDLELITKELGLNKGISFEKKISALYFHDSKNSVIKKLSPETKTNFQEVLDSINILN